MYKAKVFKGDYLELELNNLFKKFPENAEIISIEYITSPSGSFSCGGYGKINAETKILVVWKE